MSKEYSPRKCMLKCKRNQESPSRSYEFDEELVINGSFRRAFPSPEKSLAQSNRSLSLEDLSHNVKYDSTFRRSFEMRPNSSASERGWQGDRFYGLKGYTGFLRNAWRRTRDETAKRDREILSITKKATNLTMQVSSLKQILFKDERLVASWSKEIHNLRSLLSKSLDEISFLRQEKSRLEVAVEEKELEIEQLKVELMNEKNTCQLAKSEAAALEAILAKEREKISRLREELQSLSEQLKIACTENEEKEERLQKLEFNVEDLAGKVELQEELLKSSELKIIDDARALRVTVEDMQWLKGELANQYEINTQLKDKTVELEKSISEKDVCFMSLEKYCQDQLVKMVENQAKHHIMESKKTVVTILKVLSSLATVPLAIVEAVVFPDGPIFRAS